MPSKPRAFYPDTLHHIYNRGTQQMNIFHKEKDYNRFLEKTQEYKEHYNVEILAYCLMPNHFHFLLRDRPSRPLRSKDLKGHSVGHSVGQIAESESGIPRFLQQLQNSYAKYFANQYEFSGRVFQGTYKAKHVKDDAYYSTLCAYIHDNPVKKGLVQKPEEWGWSSYLALSHPTFKVPTTLKVDIDPTLSDQSHEEIYKNFVADRDRGYEEIRDFV